MPSRKRAVSSGLRSGTIVTHASGEKPGRARRMASAATRASSIRPEMREGRQRD